MSDEEFLRKRYPQFFKPVGCTLRRIKPRGPLKGCKEDCSFFEECVELKMQEKERLDSFDA